jgi:hypothetical protein
LNERSHGSTLLQHGLQDAVITFGGLQ